jgi:hypothetical protein
MDVFGTFNQFGERSERFPGGFSLGRVDFEKNGAVALDDEGVFGVIGHQSNSTSIR